MISMAFRTPAELERVAQFIACLQFQGIKFNAEATSNGVFNITLEN